MAVSQTSLRKARAFASRWGEQVETVTSPALWSIAARTWNDKARNERLWEDALAAALRDAAGQAFDALGGFDDAATVMAASGPHGLLALIDGSRSDA